MAVHTIGCLMGCGRPAHSRGVCLTCTGRQNRAIVAGETTDAELVAHGLRLSSAGSITHWLDLLKSCKRAAHPRPPAEGD
jgi:hypothetical protein